MRCERAQRERRLLNGRGGPWRERWGRRGSVTGRESGKEIREGVGDDKKGLIRTHDGRCWDGKVTGPR